MLSDEGGVMMPKERSEGLDGLGAASGIDPQLLRELLGRAEEAAGGAYAPYSGFHVGAALLLADGGIQTGCNIENASYGATVCAERVAVWSALAGGRLGRGMPPRALAVTAQPCAMCLQVLAEFAGAELPVLVRDGAGVRMYRLGELLPYTFRLNEAVAADLGFDR